MSKFSAKFLAEMDQAFPPTSDPSSTVTVTCTFGTTVVVRKLTIEAPDLRKAQGEAERRLGEWARSVCADGVTNAFSVARV